MDENLIVCNNRDNDKVCVVTGGICEEIDISCPHFELKEKKDGK